MTLLKPGLQCSSNCKQMVEKGGTGLLAGKTPRAGLLFLLGRIHHHLKTRTYELDLKAKRITPRHLQLAIRGDGVRSFKSFKQIVKRLEEASIFARGPERIYLMRRWLTALKETEKLSGGSLKDDEKNQELHLPYDELK
nr:hypothetical protein [Tanacetum cinerariifolium]